MSEARFLVGDVRERMAELPDNSVDLILTSPPFLALRSYLPADHPDKQLEIGSEANPAAFLDVLLELTAEWGRLLAPHGSIAVELGDTYSGSSQSGGDRSAEANGQSTRQRRGARDPDEPDRTGAGWPLAKSLALVPELYRIGLAYGINPLTGTESPAGRWLVRNVVRWCRPNPPVGALGDKFRPATTDMVVATRSARRWFDLDAVRTVNEPERMGRTDAGSGFAPADQALGSGQGNGANHPAGAPPLDYWVIPTEAYRNSHYATWPRKLCEIPIQSMCPRQVCVVCGEPRRRIVRVNYELDETRPQAARAMDLYRQSDLTPAHLDAVRAVGISDAGKALITNDGAGNNAAETQRLADEAKCVLGGYFREFTYNRTVPAGWTDCGHDSWRRGLVLDPFAGSGTTLAVATGMGRDAVGIDLDPRNADLAAERVGMFLTVDS